MPRKAYTGTVTERSEQNGTYTLGIIDTFAENEFIPIASASDGGMHSLNTENLRQLEKRNNDRLRHADKMCKECQKLLKNGDIDALSKELLQLDKHLQKLLKLSLDASMMNSALLHSLDCFMDFFDKGEKSK